MGKYLKRWGSEVLAAGQAGRRTRSGGRSRLVRGTWPAIRARAKADNAEVLFGDPVGIRSDQVTGRTWGAEGATPVVRRTGIRFSVNAMFAISAKGRMHLIVFTETFWAKATCRFLARFGGHFDRKVDLIVDWHPAHCSKAVWSWLVGHKEQVELHFLPSY
ncbi:transposase [Streptomyces sp. NPDC056527]|uniref:transposase n=1 Tax=Streptomyces sp. NPDC056527 TaxID=3345853 RepID=UPI0036C1F375